MALDANQRAALARFKVAARAEGLAAFTARVKMHRNTVQAVLSDTAREASIFLALDRFAKSKAAV